jgi:hypothetical protein
MTYILRMLNAKTEFCLTAQFDDVGVQLCGNACALGESKERCKKG